MFLFRTCLLFQTIKTVRPHFIGQILQDLDTACTISLFIQSRSEYTDSHPVHKGYRDPPPTPLFAGNPTVMANSPDPSYIPHVSISARIAPGILRLDQLFLIHRVRPMVCQHQTHIRNITGRHIDGTHPEIEIQALFHVPFQNAGRLQVIRKRPVPVSGRPFGLGIPVHSGQSPDYCRLFL